MQAASNVLQAAFNVPTPIKCFRTNLCCVACRHTAWVAWLQAAATIDDCKLSSHAARALLHLESARCFPSSSTYKFEHNLYEPQMLHRYGLLKFLFMRVCMDLASVHTLLTLLTSTLADHPCCTTCMHLPVCRLSLIADMCNPGKLTLQFASFPAACSYLKWRHAAPKQSTLPGTHSLVTASVAPRA